MSIVVAWDIETCPEPMNELTRSQERRHEKEVRATLRRNPEMSEEEASKLVRSIHPFLGWVCCISAVSGPLQKGSGRGEFNQPVCWVASSPDEERSLLERFWQDIEGFPAGTVWATFNGKRFDVPFIEARSLVHGISPTRGDIRSTYPYAHRPHADLSWLWPQHYSLDGLCNLLGVPSPKSEGVEGSQVAALVEAGEVDTLIEYAKRDAIATWRCCQVSRAVWDN